MTATAVTGRIAGAPVRCIRNEMMYLMLHRIRNKKVQTVKSLRKLLSVHFQSCLRR